MVCKGQYMHVQQFVAHDFKWWTTFVHPSPPNVVQERDANSDSAFYATVWGREKKYEPCTVFRKPHFEHLSCVMLFHSSPDSCLCSQSLLHRYLSQTTHLPQDLRARLSPWQDWNDVRHDTNNKVWACYSQTLFMLSHMIFSILTY